jgi:asparagine synthase (glutamine-hydrolysing)
VCGIAGVWNFAGGRRDDLLARAGQMATILSHRGPDDSGTWAHDRVGIALGFRRLSIVDLSPAGAQPMQSASGRFVIVFNGEIYNFRRLRLRLEEEGAAPAWRGHSDTEVLLAAIEAWGLERALHECIGMFAFALWDEREGTLQLVRDRAGVKPLYYALSAQSLEFASELKAVSSGRMIDREAAALYARYRYVPAPWSIREGVRKLEAGSILEVRRNGSSTLTKYWDAATVVDRAAAHRFVGSEQEATDALGELLSDSVGLRMIADVPLGVFLSGGVDSSLVAALMQKNASVPIRTFTIGFEDARFDEARYGREVAQVLGATHEELYLRSTDAMALIPQIPRIFDEPFGDSSALPTYLVSRLARGFVTVALSGDGGDELFGGYHHHFLGHRLQRRIAAFPKATRRAAGALLQRIPRTQSLGRALLEDDALTTYHRTILLDLASGPAPRFQQSLPHLADPIERVMFLDFVRYLQDDILTKVDRTSMAVSLEAREPFLDHRVIELAWSLPLSMKIRDDRGKWIVRELLRRHLPDHLVDREKQGFGLPVAEWLRGPLREWTEDLLANADEAPFDMRRVRSLWHRHLAGENHQGALWAVLMYEEWRRSM